MKSICIVSGSLGSGGAERIAVNIALHYSKNGYQTTILVFRKEGQYANEIPKDINLIELKNKSGLSAIIELNKILRKNKFNTIISTTRGTSMFIGLGSIFSKSRLIFREANTLDELKYFSFYRRIKRITLMKLSYLFSHKVIANSFDTKKDLLKYKITKNDKIVVIGNPVLYSNVIQKIDEPVDDEWLNNNKYKTILNIGRLHQQKNHPFLLKAFSTVVSQIPEAKLIILGEGEEKNNLLSLINMLKLENSVKILEFKSNPFPYYKSADLFVLSSSWEGFGNVIVESMASGTPVVSINCPGGPKMILDNGVFGDLVPPGDVDIFSQTIITNILNPKNEEYIEKIKNRAWEYSLENIADLYIK